MVSTACSAGRLALWKARDVLARRARSRASCSVRQASGAPPRRSAPPRSRCGASPSSRSAMFGQPPPSRASRTSSTMRAHRRLQRGVAALRGPRQRRSRVRSRQLAPDQPFHIIIFSMGTTRIAEAPASFSFCSVSQKTNSWQTAWTAKWPGRPCSGRMVGASAPGRMRGDLVERLLGRVQHDIFDSWVASTPSIRLSSCSASSAVSGGERLAGADQHRLAVEHRLDGAQAIGLQRRAGRDQVADEAGDLQPRRELDRAVHLHDRRPRRRCSSRKRWRRLRIGGGDPRAGERSAGRHKRSCSGAAIFSAAAAEAEPRDELEAGAAPSPSAHIPRARCARRRRTRTPRRRRRSGCRRRGRASGRAGNSRPGR